MNAVGRHFAVRLFILIDLAVLFAVPISAQSIPCEQIKDACKKAGFVAGGGRGDGGLLQDCFNPIVQGTPQPTGASRRLPKIDSKVTNACRASAAPAGSPAGLSASQAMGTLTPADRGQTVFDASKNVTWLANANLAATETFGVPNINRSGSMDYKTALQWVSAMNAYDHGAGYLGHTNWTLPTTPAEDASCASHNVNSFGFGCMNSAMGSLYYRGLGLRAPNTAVPIPHNKVGPFSNFQPYLYWSASPNANHPENENGFTSFSFNSGFQGSNVSRNHLYVLPMILGKLPGTPVAVGKALQVNPDGRTIYDPLSDVTWLADANLAATQTFGVRNIDPDGSMEHATAVQWVNAMNAADKGRGYLGQKRWQLPPNTASDPQCSMKATFGFGCAGSPLGKLFYDQLGLGSGESVVAAPDIKTGPFHNLQPYLYWSCTGGPGQATCRSDGPAPGFEWSFSFGDGFQGTDVLANNLYVMAYHPGPP